MRKTIGDYIKGHIVTGGPNLRLMAFIPDLEIFKNKLADMLLKCLSVKSTNELDLISIIFNVLNKHPNQQSKQILAELIAIEIESQ